MKFFVVLLCISAAICVYAADLDLEKEWSDFKVKFERNYSPEEEETRKQIFAEHLKRVDEHNKKFDEKIVSYSIGINQFSDLTEDERKKLHGGVILPNAVKDAVDE